MTRRTFSKAAVGLPAVNARRFPRIDAGRESAVHLDSGLVDHQVLQRTFENTANVQLSGSATGCNGLDVQARLLSRGLELQEFSWSSLAEVKDEKWSGEIKN